MSPIDSWDKPISLRLKLALRRQAAMCVLGVHNAEEIKATIDDVVREGFCVDACIDALNSSPAEIRDVLPGLVAALAHCSLSLPNAHEAIRHLVEHHMRRITNREITPLAGLSAMVAEVYWDYDVHQSSIQYVGDAYDIQYLIGMYWGVVDLRERPDEVSCNGKYGMEAIAQLELLIAAECARWLKANAPDFADEER